MGDGTGTGQSLPPTLKSGDLNPEGLERGALRDGKPSCQSSHWVSLSGCGPDLLDVWVQNATNTVPGRREVTQDCLGPQPLLGRWHDGQFLVERGSVSGASPVPQCAVCLLWMLVAC